MNSQLPSEAFHFGAALQIRDALKCWTDPTITFEVSSEIAGRTHGVVGLNKIPEWAVPRWDFFNEEWVRRVYGTPEFESAAFEDVIVCSEGYPKVVIRCRRLAQWDYSECEE